MKDLPLKIVRTRLDLFEAAPHVSTPRSEEAFETLSASARGFARTNPDRLLANMGLTDFYRGHKNKEQAIISFLAEAIAAEVDGERLLSILFENPVKRGSNIIIRVKTYEVSDGSKLNATTDKNCKRFINSLLLAGARKDKIQWDDEKDECVVSSESGIPVAIIKLV